MTLDARAGDGDAAPAFAPGQFTMLYAFGVGEVPISVSGDPARPRPLVHTIRAVGAVDATRSARPRPGAVVGVRGPFGNGWPVAAAAGGDVVVVAGGIGLAPLRPASCTLLARRERYGRRRRSSSARARPRDLLFADELERWRGAADLEVEVTVDPPAPAGRALSAS